MSGEAPGTTTGLSALILHLLMSGVLGMVANGSSVIYEIEEWSIARATITHFTIAMWAFFVRQIDFSSKINYN